MRIGSGLVSEIQAGEASALYVWILSRECLRESEREKVKQSISDRSKDLCAIKDDGNSIRIFSYSIQLQ